MASTEGEDKSARNGTTETDLERRAHASAALDARTDWAGRANLFLAVGRTILLGLRRCGGDAFAGFHLALAEDRALLADWVCGNLDRDRFFRRRAAVEYRGRAGIDGAVGCND